MQIRKKLPILKKKNFTNGVKNIIRQLFAGESHQVVKKPIYPYVKCNVPDPNP